MVLHDAIFVPTDGNSPSILQGAAPVATRLFRLLGWMTLRDTFRLIRLLKSKDQNHHLQPSLRAVPALWQASQHHALAG